MNAIALVIPSAVLLVIAGVIFGVVCARAYWDDDFKFRRHLDQITADSISHMQSTIETQRRTIDMMRVRP